MRHAAALFTAFAVLVGGAPRAAATDARRALDEGFARFAAREYERAAAAFERAAALAPSEGLDPAVAGYDRAIALLRAGKGIEAAAALGEVLASPNSELRESAHYHRGIALTAAAEAVERGGELRRALSHLEEALDAYEGAMRIDPRDEDPKINHELVTRMRARLLERLQAQERERGSRGRDRAGSGRAEESPEPPQAEQGVQRRGGGKEMSPGEARALLDALRQHEQAQRGRTRPFGGAATPVEKDW